MEKEKGQQNAAAGSWPCLQSGGLGVSVGLVLEVGAGERGLSEDLSMGSGEADHPSLGCAWIHVVSSSG